MVLIVTWQSAEFYIIVKICCFKITVKERKKRLEAASCNIHKCLMALYFPSYHSKIPTFCATCVLTLYA